MDAGGCESAVTGRARFAWKKFCEHLPILTEKRVFIKTERQAICYLCDNSCLMYGTETRLTKAEHELKLNLTEMSMIRWMWRVKLNKRKKSEELIELSGFGTSQSDDQEEYVEMIWTC